MYHVLVSTHANVFEWHEWVLIHKFCVCIAFCLLENKCLCMCDCVYVCLCVCVCVCVCVGLYIPAIVDRHRDFYMQTWTFVNRGSPRILEEVH